MVDVVLIEGEFDDVYGRSLEEDVAVSPATAGIIISHS